MTTSVKVCLSYYPLKWVFIAFKLNIILLRKCIADTDVVNDVTRSRQSVITRVVIRFYGTTSSTGHMIKKIKCKVQLHGPSMFAVKAKIYDVHYNPASSIDFDETSSYWSAPKSF